MTTSAPVHPAMICLLGTFDGFLFGLLGAGARTSPAREAMMLRRVLGLVVVLAAWIFRTKTVALAMHLDAVLTLLAGSLAGAWCATGKARDNTWLCLDRIILVVLPIFALAMLAQAVLDDRGSARLFASATTGALAGVLAGFCIGFAMTAMGAAASVLVVPALVVLFGIDSKVAGSLALTIILPTLLVGLRQFSGAALVPFIRKERRLLLAVSGCSLTGAACGVLLLGVITSRAILVAMLMVLFYAALTESIVFFAAHLRVKS